MTTAGSQRTAFLDGIGVALLGQLAAMSRRDAGKLIARHGGRLVDAADPAARLLVVGEDDVLRASAGGELADLLTPEARQAAEQGELEVVTETQLWQRLGVLDDEADAQRLYTAGMLASLLSVPVAVIRRWHRRGLIAPVREVHRLAYFDFQQVATARRLAEMLAAGMSPQRIEKQLASLRRILPGVERPLAQLSVIVEGKDILLRQGEGLVDAGGQMRFDFEPAPPQDTEAAPQAIVLQARGAGDGGDNAVPSAEDLLDAAAAAEDEGDLELAVEMQRSALMAGGPDPDACFHLAELLYRTGDLAAARERYAMAIEIDENFVEARANLGCVLAELGEPELAVAALQGALRYHAEYPDAQYHLARILCAAGRDADAQPHWRAFLELAPESPWAEEARMRHE